MKNLLIIALSALMLFASVQPANAQSSNGSPRPWDSWGVVQGMQQDARKELFPFGKVRVRLTWPTIGPPTITPAIPYTPSYFNLAQEVPLPGTHDVSLEEDAWVWMWTVRERMEWVWQLRGTVMLFDANNQPVARKDCHNPAFVIVYLRRSPPPTQAASCSCWDTNGDGTADIPDRNNDGNINEADCTIIEYKDRNWPCWDKNRDGVGNPNENTNGDAVVDDRDCQVYLQPPACPLGEGDVVFKFSTTMGHRILGVFKEIDEWGPSVGIGAGGTAIAGGDLKDVGIAGGASFGLNWVAHIFKPDANRLKILVKGTEVVTLERGQRQSFKYGKFEAVAWWEGESAQLRILGFTECAWAEGKGENYHLTPLIYINNGSDDVSTPPKKYVPSQPGGDAPNPPNKVAVVQGSPYDN